MIEYPIKELSRTTLKGRFLVAFLLLFCSLAASAQNRELKEIVQDLTNYQKEAVQEKVFVHHDRPLYLAGENMWFKVYVVDGSRHKPLELSRVAYLEILDKDQKAVLQSKIPMKEGSGKGFFYLPLSLPSGNYTLRAYTHWMKNFGPEFYFQESISVVNSFIRPKLEPEGKPLTYDVQFFPEGGNLVKGIRSKVAFRAVSQEGKGIEFKGVVVNQDQDTITHFKPFKHGIGTFYFTPSSEQSYRAILKTETGDSLSYKLPAAYEKGYVMHLAEEEKEQIKISVQTNSQQIGNVYLLVHSRDSVIYAMARKVQDGKVEFYCSKESLGEGVSHLTIFNYEKQPVAERLYFKLPADNFSIEAASNQAVYHTREEVKVAVSARHEAGKPVLADMSMAVYQLDSLNSNEPANIMHYLWLKSELKGRIESPEYYFNSKGAEVEKATDNLMLTHGWSRFRWEDILDKENFSFPFIPEYEAHMLQAKVTDQQSGAPAGKVLSFLSVPGSASHFYVARSKEDGLLHFVSRDFEGAGEIILQPASGEQNQLDFQFISPFSDQFAPLNLPPFDISEKVSASLQTRSIGMQAQHAYREDERSQFVEPANEPMAFYGQPDKKYVLDNYTRFPTMEEVMREFVYEVQVRKTKGKFRFKVWNAPYSVFFDEDPLILLDGVPVESADKMLAFNPLEVEKIEVLTGKYIMGAGNEFNGILSYTTYKGDLGGFELDPQLVRLDYEGLQQQKEFFSPVYGQEQEMDKRIPDFRNLLYWAPDLRAAQKKEEELRFYTSDLEGTYKVVIQGISREGKTGYKTFTFQVQKESL